MQKHNNLEHLQCHQKRDKAGTIQNIFSVKEGIGKDSNMKAREAGRKNRVKVIIEATISQINKTDMLTMRIQEWIDRIINWNAIEVTIQTKITIIHLRCIEEKVAQALILIVSLTTSLTQSINHHIWNKISIATMQADNLNLNIIQSYHQEPPIPVHFEINCLTDWKSS